MSPCSEIVNLVVVFLLLPVAALGEFCSAKLQSWFWCVLLCVCFVVSFLKLLLMRLCMIEGIDQTQRVCEP